jgi:hypothetical protein
MEVSDQLHAPAALPLRESPWYLLDKRLGVSQSRCGRSGEDKNSQSLPGLEPQIIQPIAQRYTTELHRLLTHKMKIILLKFYFIGYQISIIAHVKCTTNCYYKHYGSSDVYVEYYYN